MALFNTKKEKEEKVVVEDSKKDSTATPASDSQKESFSDNSRLANILIGPRITEKATDSQQRNVYVFEINPRSNKYDVSSAVQAFYKVKPIRVNIVKTPAKTTWMRGKKGTKKGIKKAYVFLKEGDRIELV